MNPSGGKATFQYHAGQPPARIVGFNHNNLQSRLSLAVFRVEVGDTSASASVAQGRHFLLRR